MRDPRIRSVLLVGALALAAAVPATGETARDVLQTAMERHDARLRGIENYTVVQEVMGFEVTTHYETRIVNGHRVPVARERGEGSADATPMLFASLPELAERARLDGTVEIDGRSCYALRVEDLGDLDLAPDLGESTAGFAPESMLVHLDREDYLPRKMRIDGTADQDGRPVPVTLEMVPGDYRTVEGLVHPHVTTVTVQGLASAISPEDREEARRALAEMKAQMAQMPEAQREMMASMMGSQMQRMEEMVNSGEMTVTVNVREIRVNQPAP